MESSRMASLRRAAEVLREEADAYERQMAIPRRDEMLALADELEAIQGLRESVIKECASMVNCPDCRTDLLDMLAVSEATAREQS